MSPAINFGNWLRKVCPWIRKNTPPLNLDEPEQELSVIDQIMFNVLRDNEVMGNVYERNSYVTSIGDLLIYKNLGSNRARVEYKGEDVGFCSNREIFSLLNDKILKYHERLREALEPERIKQEQEREARLLEILKEVTNEPT